MTTLTLLTKIYSSNQRKHIANVVKDLFEDLAVDASFTGSLNERWVHVSLSGEDEAIATNLLARDFGFCPVTLEKIEKSSTLKGFVSNLKNSKEALHVDVGVFQPKPIHATVSLSNLQTTLASERKTSLGKLSDLWCICENLPLTIKVVDVNPEENLIAAELATEQVEKYMFWRDSLLDRLIVLGISLSQAKLAVEQAMLQRDVIDIESLGMFEHALVCKLGTDAAGLIPRLGRRVRAATFFVYSPRKVNAFFGSQ